MAFGLLLRQLREERKMTLRQLGESAGQDYIMLNKIELGQRVPPPLEGIFALADALGRVQPLKATELEKLIDLAAEDNGKANARFSKDEVNRLKKSTTAELFFTRRNKK